MTFAGHIALRFLRSRRSRFVNLITVIAVLGIGLGVMVLGVTLAVMNGFRDQIQLSFVENMPMVTVLTHDPRGFEDIPALLERLEGIDGVEAAAPFLRNEGVLTQHRGRTRNKAVVVWGIDPARQDRVTPISSNIQPEFQGFDTSHLLDGGQRPGVVLGVELAATLYAGLGDVITLTVPTNTSGSLEEIEGRSVELRVVGVLTSGMFEFDQTFAYVGLDALRDLLGREGADGIGIRVTEMMRASQVARELEDRLGPPFWANDWISLNSQLFEWIQMEKVMMFLLLLLISLVASFGVVAILTMTVRDRQHDIGVFLSLGVPRRTVTGIFVALGMMLGCLGTLAGTVAGLLLCWALDAYGFALPGDVYFVDTLPVHVKALDVSLVALVSLAMSFLATLLPSWLASRFPPAEVLRHE